MTFLKASTICDLFTNLGRCLPIRPCHLALACAPWDAEAWEHEPPMAVFWTFVDALTTPRRLCEADVRREARSRSDAGSAGNAAPRRRQNVGTLRVPASARQQFPFGTVDRPPPHANPAPARLRCSGTGGAHGWCARGYRGAAHHGYIERARAAICHSVPAPETKSSEVTPCVTALRTGCALPASLFYARACAGTRGRGRPANIGRL